MRFALFLSPLAMTKLKAAQDVSSPGVKKNKKRKQI
jgi:hypothetical protein